MSYTIKLPQFEGPFDLLLFFIERDELDIYNIPIAKIANDFLEYIKMMEAMNIDLASEFILVAATLMRIKVKMLLPRKEIDELGNEIDPREELVQRLIEYKRYKSVIEELKILEGNRRSKNIRGNVRKELKQLASKALVDAEWETLTLFNLLKTFEKVVKRMEDHEKRQQSHFVVRYNYTLADQQKFLIQMVATHQKTDFVQLFDLCDNRIHAIFRFLALLELIQMDQLSIINGEGINNFWIALPKTEETP